MYSHRLRVNEDGEPCQDPAPVAESKVRLPEPQCPQCRSTRLYRDGLRYLRDSSQVQRLLCRDCGYRFSEGGPRRRKEGREPLQESSEWRLKGERCILGSRQVCVTLARGAKNLAAVETRQETASREGTTQIGDVKGKIVQFLWYMEKENKSKRSIASYARYLNMLIKIGANLLDPESIKEKVAKQEKWGENTRRMAMAVYKSFASFNGIYFTPPKYKINQKLPFIPLESEIDALIVASTRRLAAALQLLKEIPIRIGETLRLKWTDIDFQRQCIIVNNTEKNGKPRAFKASQKLLDMLNALQKKNEKLFGLADYRSMENQFVVTRNRVANKLQNPRLMQIHFHTFRHWKATMEYHNRDILHVMNLLGHRNIESTLVYTQLISFESDEYHSAVAKTVEEARKLLEQGFDYVCQKDDIMLFRKRK